jgi:hypothetical protein
LPFLVVLSLLAGLCFGTTSAYALKTHYDNDVAEKYRHYNTAAPNLPSGFKKHGTTVNFYYSDPNDGAVYCMEVDNGTFEMEPDEFDTPSKSYSQEQLALIKYVLAHGQHEYKRRNNKAVERQAATQLVLWLICENLHKDAQAVDSVLYPADGSSIGYAQTYEVGALGRKMLQEALDVYSGKIPAPEDKIPSFTSRDKDNAPEHAMSWDSSRNRWYVDLEDENGVLADKWQDGRLSDKIGNLVNISVSGNKMTVSGSDEDIGKVVALQHKTIDGTVKFLRNSSRPNYQSMSHYVRSQPDGEEIYLRLTTSAVTDPGTDPDKSELTVMKYWNDASDRSKRPYSIAVQLMKDGQPEGDLIGLNEKNNWTHHWEGLETGHNWWADEVEVPANYVKKIFTSGDGSVVTIMNSLENEPTTTPPAVDTPPAITTPPGVDTPPAITTPPAVDTPPAITTPPGTITPPGTTTPPGTDKPTGNDNTPDRTTPPAITTLPAIIAPPKNPPVMPPRWTPPDTPSTVSAPRTGDSFPAAGLIAVLVGAGAMLAGFAVAHYLRGRRRKG